MIPEYVFKQLLEDKDNKKHEYVFINKHGKVVVYSNRFPEYRAIGLNETDALLNLSKLFGELVESRECGIDKCNNKEILDRKFTFKNIIKKVVSVFK